MPEKEKTQQLLQELSWFIYHYIRSIVEMIVTLTRLKKVTSEENTRAEDDAQAHIEDFIPYHLKAYLKRYGLDAVKITSIENQVVIVRNPDNPNNTAIPSDWEKMVKWAQGVASGRYSSSAQEDRQKAIFVLKTNIEILDNHNRVVTKLTRELNQMLEE